jgi:hypothetical protein
MQRDTAEAAASEAAAAAQHQKQEAQARLMQVRHAAFTTTFVHSFTHVPFISITPLPSSPTPALSIPVASGRHRVPR